MKIKDEDKAILLVVSLPPSYKHFKEIMLYSNSNTISVEDVKSNLLSKEKFDHDIHADSVEGLVVRGRTTEKGNGKRRKTVPSLEILMLVKLRFLLRLLLIMLLT